MGTKIRAEDAREDAVHVGREVIGLGVVDPVALVRIGSVGDVGERVHEAHVGGHSTMLLAKVRGTN